MEKYHKIPTIYERDPGTKHKTVIEGHFSRQEFHYLYSNDWEFTEKIDGTNTRVIWDGFDRYEIKGKTDNANHHPALTKDLYRLFSEKAFDYSFGETAVCLYGEAYGPKATKDSGKYGKVHGFALFDIRIGDWWLKSEQVEFIGHELGLEVAPIVGMGDLGMMVKMVKEGFKSAWGNFVAEGLIARPTIQLFNRKGERIITKLKHRDFLHDGEITWEK